MSFIRPEAQAALWQWREALVGSGLILLGLWWIFGPGGLLAIPGFAFVGGGIALSVLGAQRARFRGKNDGAGAVEVDEGQITYYGPLNGGAIALRELERLSLDARGLPPHWRLDQPGRDALLIPVNAAGSDALFDAFATLPGLKTERMLMELRTRNTQAVVIWERRPLRPAGAVLH